VPERSGRSPRFARLANPQPPPCTVAAGNGGNPLPLWPLTRAVGSLQACSGGVRRGQGRGLGARADLKVRSSAHAGTLGAASSETTPAGRYYGSPVRANAYTKESGLTYPSFTVTAVSDGGDAVVYGHLSRTWHGRENWVSDHWLGVLVRDKQAVAGRWKASPEGWVFLLEDSAALGAFEPGARWDVLDGYWGERAEIVLDASRRWHETTFAPSDAVEFRGGGTRWQMSAADVAGGGVVEGGWDHEHCAICWETIDADRPEAYFSEPNKWVCKECFEAFVRQRSLGFIPEAQ
jgi:hypothetical protein